MLWRNLASSVCCEAAVRRGTAKSLDHAQLVHSQWLEIAANSLNIHVRRVATDDNIADLPSRWESATRAHLQNQVYSRCRLELGILRQVGATEVEPKLPSRCESQECWNILHERWAKMRVNRVCGISLSPCIACVSIYA